MANPLLSDLLRFWRKRSGLTQRDLASAADISTRHLSFLETGRAQPGQTTLHKLIDILGVPLRVRNEMLRAAGTASQFVEPEQEALSPAVGWALDRMLRQQEPYPLTVLTPDYDIVRANHAARQVFSAFIAQPEHLTEPLNMYTLLFDPRFVRPFVQNWDKVAGMMIARLRRETYLERGGDRSAGLLQRVLRQPGLPADCRRADFSVEPESTLVVRLGRGDLEIGFLTTLTTFAAPLVAAAQDLRIESYFPVDVRSQAACAHLAQQACERASDVVPDHAAVAAADRMSSAAGNP